MSQKLKNLVRIPFRAVGLDVKRYIPHPRHHLATLLGLYGVEAVFDLGANIGNSGRYFRNLGFQKLIVSAEPVDELFHALLEEARGDPAWICKRVAVGEAEKYMDINVSAGGGSASSFLPMTDNIKVNAPSLVYKETERVKVTTVDALARLYYPRGERLFLKIDVQGYERNVLDGAEETLDRIVGLRIELSLVESYSDEPLIQDMLPYLYSLGFRLHGIEPGWSNFETQEIYQVDATLFRPPKLKART